MTSKRLIGCILVRHGLAVQSFSFHRYLPIGKPEIAAEYLDRWGVDEIVLLDIDATPEDRAPNLKMIETVATKIFTPLTVGGGVTSARHFQDLLRAGADKISLNSAFLSNPDIVTMAAERFGSQCVIASIDAFKTANRYVARDSFGAPTHSVQTLAALAEEKGAGEILLNSVERDGTQTGYDLELLAQVGANTSIPIILLGGAGHPDHIAEAMRMKTASAVAVANMLHHTEHSVTAIKGYLKRARLSPRQVTIFEYTNDRFDETGRLAKKDEAILDDLGLIRVERDAI